MDRMQVIQELAVLIGFKSSAHKVDLKNPQITVVVEVIKGLCCISILPDYFKLKKYNVHELTNEEKRADEGKSADGGKSAADQETAKEDKKAAVNEETSQEDGKPVVDEETAKKDAPASQDKAFVEDETSIDKMPVSIESVDDEKP